MSDAFELEIPKDAASALEKLSGYFHPNDLKDRRVEFNDLRLAVSLLELAKEFEPLVIDQGPGGYVVDGVKHIPCAGLVFPEDRWHDEGSLFDLLMIARGHKCPEDDEDFCDHPNGFEMGRCPCGASAPVKEDD